MHEVYQAPKGGWENIYINSHLSGIGRFDPSGLVDAIGTDDSIIADIRAPVNWPEEGIRPLADAKRGSLRTQTGRMSRGDGADNEKYGPEPY